MTIAIGLAKSQDRPGVLSLLEHSGLPKDGLSNHWATTFVARDGDRVVGSAALELCGRAALLRSVAVEETWRGRGLGQKLTQAALDLACQQGVKTLYLLTETAADFFQRFGFRRLSRSEVPATIQRSVEFTRACPESAQAMVMDLSIRRGGGK